VVEINHETGWVEERRSWVREVRSISIKQRKAQKKKQKVRKKNEGLNNNDKNETRQTSGTQSAGILGKHKCKTYADKRKRRRPIHSTHTSSKEFRGNLKEERATKETEEKIRKKREKRELGKRFGWEDKKPIKVKRKW